MLKEAKTSRPMPELRGRGRGQDYEVEAEAKRIMKKVVVINNIWFEIIAGKINKIPEFYTIFARKNTRLHNKTTRSRPGRGRGQHHEAEEAKILASRPLWPRGLNITGDQWLTGRIVTS